MAHRDDQRYLAASIESARYFNGVMAEAAATAGVFSALRDFKSALELCKAMSFHPAKRQVVAAFLNVLTDNGLLERKQHGAETVYRSRGHLLEQQRRLDGGLQRYRPKVDVLDPWTGEYHADVVRHYMLKMIGDDLTFLRKSQHMRFDAEYFEPWKWNLTNPMYEWGRLKVVEELVKYGNRFMDLACGPGFGTQRLAQYCPAGCEILAVDKSADFIDIAERTVLPNAKVRFVHRDLNTGLPPEVPKGYFDGILFNGAFHFIKDKPALLREMRRALRPGGLLVIGHCFSRSGFADESMHDLYFSIIENDCFAEPWEHVRSHVHRAGFEEFYQFHRGSHSYLLARRDTNPGDAPDARNDRPPLVMSVGGLDESRLRRGGPLEFDIPNPDAAGRLVRTGNGASGTGSTLATSGAPGDATGVSLIISSSDLEDR
jgi:SAM-dependent methyltransferase